MYDFSHYFFNLKSLSKNNPSEVEIKNVDVSVGMFYAFTSNFTADAYVLTIVLLQFS